MASVWGLFADFFCAYFLCDFRNIVPWDLSLSAPLSFP